MLPSGAKDDGWPKETGGKEGRIEQSIEDAQKAVADELHRLYSHMQKLFADSESSRVLTLPPLSLHGFCWREG